MKPKRVLIMGAAGRDYHNFNVFFRNNPAYRVIAFTASQIPGIAGRLYPPSLAGRLYPNGIPVYPEEMLPELVKRHNIDAVILAYSDLHHTEVMHKASLVNSLGPDFILMGTASTMLKSSRPVIAVTAVRTGCGKSQTTRRIAEILKSRGKRVGIVRHPMPYGELERQAIQRFESLHDLERNRCTLEEREEYEHLIESSDVVYAGIDYARILRKVERECDVILWDGGNNDTPFFAPDLHIVITDPHRPGHEKSYYPGETNLRMADVVIINKEKTAARENIRKVKDNIARYNPKAVIIDARSEIIVSDPSLIRKKRVLVIEDGPTLTHGGMPYGAGMIAARRLSAIPVDPRPYAQGSIKAVFRKYPHLGRVLPAMGYSRKQMKELERTINKVKCDAIISGTPIDIRRVVKTNKPVVRIRYDMKERGSPYLDDIIRGFIRKHKT